MLWNRLLHLFHTHATKRTRWTKYSAFVATILFFLSIGSLVLIALWTDRIIRIPFFFSTFFSTLCGILCIVVGSAVALWAMYHFRRARGTPVPLLPPETLVSSGPYAYTRNPILSGLFLTLIGIGFILRSFALVFLWVPIFVVISILELKAVEEPELELRFGDAYREYRRCTPMFLPRLRKRKKHQQNV